MNIDDLSKVIYPDLDDVVNVFCAPFDFVMSTSLVTRAHMILLSVDMIARGEY